MDIDTNFPTKLPRVDDVPEPFRDVLKQHLSPEEHVRLMIYSPAFSTLERLSPASEPVTSCRISAPASLLAVMDDRWWVATEEERGINVEQSSFADTLFLQLTSMLLSGELRIYFAVVGANYAATVAFNTVGEELYREAIGLMLDGIDQRKCPRPDYDGGILKTWPLKFRVEAERYRPKGQPLLTATRWTNPDSGFDKTLCPSGALLITEHELVSIAEQPAFPRQHPGDLHEFGGIITYLPRIRVSDFHITHHGHFGVLALLVGAPHGSEEVEIVFPSQRDQTMLNTMQLAMQDKR